MEVPIGVSVGLIKPGHWRIGTSMSCEQLHGQPPPEDAVAHWIDGDSAWCLRPQPPTNSPSGDSEVAKFREVAGCIALWNLSPNVFCKARSWCEGVELEGKTIEFVKKHAPSVPVPEVFYNWADPAWDRTFIIERRAPGECMNDVWTQMSTEQKMDVAAQISKHAVTLAKLKSRRCEKATGAGLTFESPWLGSTYNSLVDPLWRRIVHPPLTIEEVKERITKTAGEAPPDLGEYFLFNHALLCPPKIFVHIPAEKNGHVKVSNIIGWGSAGFLPHWFIATNPRMNVNFGMENIEPPPEDQYDWTWMLSDALIRDGFSCENDWWLRIREYRRKKGAEEEARKEQESRKEQN